MNKKGGNIILSLLFFLMALGVMVAFISPLNDFLSMAQESDAMNCKGYIYEGDSAHALSYNSTLNGGNSGSPLGCMAVKLYLPYILLVFLIGGIAAVLAGKDFFGFGENESY